MSSGKNIVGVRSAAGGGAGHDGEEDPLGLLPSALRTNQADVRDRHIDKKSSASSCLSMGGLERTSNLGVAVGCCGSKDPCEAIDAILKSSKTVRNQVLWRQAQALSTYKAENQQLHKDLSLLPPTYSQYKVVRERASSRRRRRSSPTKPVGVAATPGSVSHPLNFHLQGGAGGNSGASASEQGEEPPPAGVQAGGAKELGDEGRASNGEEAVAGNDGRRKTGASVAGLEGGREEDGDGHGGGLDGKSGGVSGNEQSADEQSGGRRLSTLARAGSASGSVPARPPCPVKALGDEDVPALRRSKVRGREMVFALLQAARAEEEDMEEMLLASPPPTSVSEGGEGRRRRQAAFHSLNESRRRNAREASQAFYSMARTPSCLAEPLIKLLTWEQKERHRSRKQSMEGVNFF
ncbi:unnamed protein product [Hapterophycus canaliculatus]